MACPTRDGAVCKDGQGQLQRQRWAVQGQWEMQGGRCRDSGDGGEQLHGQWEMAEDSCRAVGDEE